MAGFVGEAVLSVFIEKLADMVTSPELWNFASEELVHSELNKWKTILMKIYAVLHDAEEKQMTNPRVKMWLDELGDLAYDVEDILDGFATESLRRNLMAETHPSGTERSTNKEAIANLLLRDDPSTDEICVIPVVGMAMELREKLSGQKFLLILDDVWNENYDSWDLLCMPMRSGAPGSKLIVTTRNEGVVSITGTRPAYCLQVLSYEDCLFVFTQQALRRSNFDAHSHLKEVGEEIVRRCKGLPLAAKALGGMLRNQDLRGKLSISGLHNVVDSQDAVDAKLEEKHNIEELTMEWGSDFVKSRNEMNEMNVLEGLRPPRNLKKLTVASYGGSTFSVEGLELFPRLRELAIRNCSKLVKQLPDRLPSLVKLDISNCQNLAVPFLRFASLGELEIEECKEMVLRSGVVADSGDQMTSRWVYSGLQSAVFERCDWLVSLDDQRLPCNLKMLKIVDCVNLKSLQNGLQSLTCLEKLEIVGCRALDSFREIDLPPRLRRLVLQRCSSLRWLPHNYSSCPLESLEIRFCPSLAGFPSGELPTTLKQLTVADCMRLRSLPDGMMHPNSTHSNNACCLQILRIHDCQSLVSFPRGELSSTLKRLEIQHCSNLESVSKKMSPSSRALEYLEMRSYPNLKILPQCLHNVKQLNIEDCGGLEGFPERGLSAPNLRELRIWRCQNLKCLPHQMKNLTSLQFLNIGHSPRVDSFPEGGLPPTLKFLSVVNYKNLKTPISEWGLHTLTSLSTLKIWGMFADKASLWDDEFLFPTSLTNLHISHMESLASLDLNSIISLQHLYIGSCPKLHSLTLRDTTLASLEIIDCPLLQKTNFPFSAHIPKFRMSGRVMYSTGAGKEMKAESHSTLSMHSPISYVLHFLTAIMAWFVKRKGCLLHSQCLKSRNFLLSKLVCHGLVFLEEQGLPHNLKYLKPENCANQEKQKTLQFGLQPCTTFYQRLCESEAAIIGVGLPQAHFSFTIIYFWPMSRSGFSIR
ncbi:putative disease resistance protein [Vitis vinifera]|uniref:Putative disease resistance protein n=1 Tax=Vitis vinifera TaxID=29760 RepID=A0A438I8J4_VITVI|nr:putative disease resistance protein [Vitis vinifera]